MVVFLFVCFCGGNIPEVLNVNIAVDPFSFLEAKFEKQKSLISSLSIPIANDSSSAQEVLLMQKETLQWCKSTFFPHILFSPSCLLSHGIY